MGNAGALVDDLHVLLSSAGWRRREVPGDHDLSGGVSTCRFGVGLLWILSSLMRSTDQLFGTLLYIVLRNNTLLLSWN